MLRPFAWIRKLLTKKANNLPIRKRVVTFRPCVERLEDRLAPATLRFLGISNDWSDAANWADQDPMGTGHVPTQQDDVVLENAAQLPIATIAIYDTNAHVNKLTINSGFTIALNGALTVEQFEFFDGVITGAGSLNINYSMLWSGGIMNGLGTTTLQSETTGVINQAPGGLAALGGWTLVNNGDLRWNGAFIVDPGSTIDNRDTLTFSAGNYRFDSTTPVLNGGTLAFDQASVVFTGPLNINNDVHVSASMAGSAVIISGDVTMRNFTLEADLSGSGALTVSNTFRWKSGSLGGDGSIVVLATGTLDLPFGTTRRLDGRTLTVQGQRTWARHEGGTGGSLPTDPADIGIFGDGYFNNTAVRPPALPAGPPVYDDMDEAGILYNAIVRTNTDEDTIWTVLERHSAPELGYISSAYATRYQAEFRALRTDLEAALSEIPDQQIRARALLDGNRPLADAAALHYALTRSGYDYFMLDRATVFRILSRYNTGTPDEIQTKLASLSSAHFGQYSTYLGVLIEQQLSGNDRTYAAYLAGISTDSSTRQRALLYMDACALNDAVQSGSWNNRSESAVQILTRNAAQRDLLLQVYTDCFPATATEEANMGLGQMALLTYRMGRGGWTTAEVDYVNRAYAGDRFALLAARLHDAMDRWGTDEQVVWDTLTGLYADERAMVAQVYRQNYGHTLLEDIVAEFSDNPIGLELTKTLRIFAHGGLTLAEQFWFGMRGWGTDDPAIRAAVVELGQMTPEQIAQVDAEYRALSGGESLRDGLYWDLCGRDWFGADQALRGRPTSLRGEVDLLLESVNYDRWTGTGMTFGDISNILSGSAQSIFNRHGTNLDGSRAELQRLISAYEAGNATEAQVRQQMSIVRRDLGTYTESRDSTTDIFANTLTTAAAVGIGIFSGGSATPVALLLYSVIGAGTNAITHVVLQGQSYDLGELPSDLLTGGIVTATAPLTFMRVPGSPNFITNVLLGAIEGGGNGASLGFAQGALTTAARSSTWDQGFELGVIRVGEAGAVNALIGMPTGAVLGGLIRAMQRLPQLRVSRSWQEHQELVTQNLISSKPGVNIGRQVTLDVTNNVTGEVETIVIDNIYRTSTGAFQLVEAKWSLANNLTDLSNNIRTVPSYTTSQRRAFTWIADGTSVTVRARGARAVEAGLSLIEPIAIVPEIQIHVNNPTGGIVARVY